MRDALPMNNGIMNPHATCSCRSHEEREPPMPLESCCPRCQGELDLVQPDLKRADALLGVCARCPAWFLIDGRNGTMIDLGLADRLSSSPLAMSDRPITANQGGSDGHDRLDQPGGSLGS